MVFAAAMPFAILLLLPASARAQAHWDVGETGREGQWTIYGAARLGSQLGLPVASGDVNGDGRDDVIITPMNADSGPGRIRTRAGEAAIVLSSGRIEGELDLAALNHESLPPDVTIIYGADSFDFLGTEVFSADLNDDGYDDVILGAQHGDGADNARAGGGEVIIAWGGPSFGGKVIDLAALQPEDAVTFVYGAEAGDRLGVWVAAGDFDGDGIDDAILGADQADGPQNSREHAGETYVVYGGPSLPALRSIDLAAPSVPVTRIFGIEREDHSGCTVRGVDLDGDGAAEILVGAGLNRASAQVDGSGGLSGHGTAGGDGRENDKPNAGEAYVVYGEQGVRPAQVDLADPPASTVIILGPDAGDAYGEEVVGGDFNGDGHGDIAIGALTGDGPGNTRNQAGDLALILGGPTLPGSIIDLFAPPNNVVFFYGAQALSIAGDTAQLEDLDRDGRDDLVIGSPEASPNERRAAGRADVFFGTDAMLPNSIDLASPPAEVTRLLLQGAQEDDRLDYSAASGDVDADGFPDLIINAMAANGFNDQLLLAGDVYVISGRLLSEAAGRAIATPTLTEEPTSTPTGSATAGTPTATPSRTPTSEDGATATPTPHSSATETPSATTTPLPCIGDCDRDGVVTVDGLVLAVNIALGVSEVDDCPAIDGNADGEATVDELVAAVNAALEGCPLPEPTSTPTTPSPSATATPTATPTEATGPQIGFFGLIRADNLLVPPSGTTDDGLPIYERSVGFGFSLVVEAHPGLSSRRVARSSFDSFDCPDLQVRVNRPLGEGSTAVCDIGENDIGGVAPLEGGGDPEACDKFNDFGCHFIDGFGNTLGRTCAEACVRSETAEFGCVMPDTTMQFCGLIDQKITFPSGDTLVTARVRDERGDLGPSAQIIVRVTGEGGSDGG
jgi:hypothetical protein